MDSNAEAEIFGKARVHKTCVAGPIGSRGVPTTLSFRLRFSRLGEVMTFEGRVRMFGSDSSAVVSPVSSSRPGGSGSGVATSSLTALSNESSSACDVTDWLL